MVCDETALASPKSATLMLSAVADQDVLRLDVAMDQPSVVGRGKGSEYRLHDLQRPARRHRRFPIEYVAQASAPGTYSITM